MRAIGLVIPCGIWLASPGCAVEKRAQSSWVCGVDRLDLIDAWMSSGEELHGWREVSKSAFDGIEHRYLRENPIFEIDRSDLEAECGLKAAGEDLAGGRLIVVRAAYMAVEPSGFEVWWSDGKLVVVHSALGRKADPRRTALVVSVPELPREALCYCSVVD